MSGLVFCSPLHRVEYERLRKIADNLSSAAGIKEDIRKVILKIEEVKLKYPELFEVVSKEME